MKSIEVILIVVWETSAVDWEEMSEVSTPSVSFPRVPCWVLSPAIKRVM